MDKTTFYDLFQKEIKKKKISNLFSILQIEEENKLAHLFNMSNFQESFCFRLLSRARNLAFYLIDDNGNINKKNLSSLINAFETASSMVYPDTFCEKPFNTHVLNVLKFFNKNNENFNILKKFTLPVPNNLIRNIIINSLNFDLSKQLKTKHIRQAVLAALLTPLRQNVGSCFATAPAILIQSEQIENFILDIYNLTTSLKLKRTIVGTEYSVPISTSYGNGDLKKKTIFPNSIPLISKLPSLCLAFEKIGLIKKDLSIEEKTCELEIILKTKCKKQGIISIEEIIRSVISTHLNIQEQQLSKHLKYNKKDSPFSYSTQNTNIERLLNLEKTAKGGFKILTENALLKTWEFTLASFSEYKSDFCKYDMYISLGFEHNEKNSIGKIIYSYLDTILQESNKKAEKLQKDVEMSSYRIKMTESMLKQASSKDQFRRLQTEHQMQVNSFYSFRDLMNKEQSVAENCSQFFKFLINEYINLFPEYFQEIYDPEMYEINPDIYDDSPAGFRLVYKHGRKDPSLWTLIYNKEDYINCLIKFFIITECTIVNNCNWEKGKEEIKNIITLITNHLRTDDFITFAFSRINKMHSERSTQNFSYKVSKPTPWCYTSGGIMDTLLKCYFCLEMDLSKTSSLISSEMELFTFLLDTMKELPSEISKQFITNKNKGMLISSPTHSFIFKPGFDLFKQGWQENKEFSYTWARDAVLLPGKIFYSQIKIEPKTQKFLLDLFLKDNFLTGIITTHFTTNYEINTQEFRSLLYNLIDAHKQYFYFFNTDRTLEMIDSFMLSVFPILDFETLKLTVQNILKDDEETLEKIEKTLKTFLLLEDIPFKIFHKLIKYCILISKKEVPFSNIELNQILEASGISLPPQAFFADTNWENFYFCFTVNPATLKLELWRMNTEKTEGFPMYDWKSYLNGSMKKQWKIFTNPVEYSEIDRRGLLLNLNLKKI